MDLDEHECRARLARADHGVLGTLHQRRGVDLVPVVFAFTGDRVLIPVDRVKAKRGRRLQRLENLRADPRCSLLVDRYEPDWSALWWVRVTGNGRETSPAEHDVALLAARYPQYRAADSITAMVVLSITEITGWSAAAP